MARGDDGSLKKTPPKRNPFRQEILSKEAVEQNRKEESASVEQEGDFFRKDGLKRLARLARGASAMPRDPRSDASAQELQQAALAEVYQSGYLSYLAAAHWSRGDVESVYALAQEQGIAAWPTSKPYLDIALALGICFSPKEASNSRGAFARGDEEDLIDFNQVLINQDTSQLEGIEIILERDDEDLNKKEILNELDKITLPFHGQTLLPPPGFTDHDIDRIISLLEGEDEATFALGGRGRESFVLGLWLGLWVNYREKVIYLPKS